MTQQAAPSVWRVFTFKNGDDEMQAFHVSKIHSEGYLEISDFFNKARPPYTLTHIKEFNTMYRRVYPALGHLERRKAEELVDHMIAHVEYPGLVRKIYGVV